MISLIYEASHANNLRFGANQKALAAEWYLCRLAFVAVAESLLVTFSKFLRCCFKAISPVGIFLQYIFFISPISTLPQKNFIPCNFTNFGPHYTKDFRRLPKQAHSASSQKRSELASRKLKYRYFGNFKTLHSY